MKKLFLAIIAIILFVDVNAQSTQEPSITYDVRFPNAKHNEAEITLTLRNISEGSKTISMSRTSPGRYALHEFAKNAYHVSAVDGAGNALKIEHPDLHNWTVSGHDGTIKFRYTLYGRHADGTYTGINEQHAHLNIPATFVWVKELFDEAVKVRFHPPKGAEWKVATQLKPTDDPYTYTASDFYYLLDSPTELSNFMTAEWKAPQDPTGQTIRLAVHHNGTEKQVKDYAGMAQKVVAEQVAVYGEPANFDYDTYTFIADYLPYVYGDGMEHRNSTILTSRRPLQGDGALQNLYTLSHEFFHSWNVERIRPKSLEPFDFQKANVSGALWFAEGFTSYYDDLIIRRAGIISDEKYANDWAGTLNYVLNSPGNKYYNPVEMSMQAPFVDAAKSVDEQNKSNTFISYYPWGAVIGLGLDLSLRSTFDGVSLDDYMQRVWMKYGKSEKPYTLDDLEQTLAEVTGSTEFATHFFDEYIRKGKYINLRSLLARAGFLLQKAHPGEAALSFGRANINYEDGKAVISGNTEVGSPLYKAGLDANDVIKSIDGKEIANARDMKKLLAASEPGEELNIKYESLGEQYKTTIRLAANPELEVLTYEQAGMQLTDEMRAFRSDWLGSKVQ